MLGTFQIKWPFKTIEIVSEGQCGTTWVPTPAWPCKVRMSFKKVLSLLRASAHSSVKMGLMVLHGHLWRSDNQVHENCFEQYQTLWLNGTVAVNAFSKQSLEVGASIMSYVRHRRKRSRQQGDLRPQGWARLSLTWAWAGHVTSAWSKHIPSTACSVPCKGWLGCTRPSQSSLSQHCSHPWWWGDMRCF